MHDTPNTNLLKETLIAIQKSEHFVHDVHHVVVKNKEASFFNKRPISIATTWDTFVEMARDFNYYNGYGSEAVWIDSRIVFNDGSFLERAEYDGSEWWRFIEIPDLNVSIMKEYDKSIMSLDSFESEEEIKRLEDKARKLERKHEAAIIKEKLAVESKPFTLDDFIN